ncbi:hypothetical protein Lfu02_49660 [Longispora fulva]|uniref:Uncharacterized protein n=1 Tax=Longispora fulva TaxID=619741 RepID=A0A8J7GHW9_9ACTN|nr:hypothetical protein [Longispora fulva]MBG6138341.1 hypothetical protein [Longispora fulva]GIG60594.1 hypothetical protein Lfu02_49660 [Longispora fulva]
MSKSLTAPGVQPLSLAGDNVAPHVAAADVDKFMALANAGVLAGKNTPCNAVQDNFSLRHDTRTQLITA